MDLKNLKISYKLGIGFGVVIIFFLGVIVTYQTTLTDFISSYTSLIKVVGEKNNLSQEINRLMLKARKSEKDFLTRKKLKYVDWMAQATEQVVEKAGQLEKLCQASNDNEGAQLARKISKHMKIYHAAFKMLVKDCLIKGLDHKSGLQGKFGKAVYTVEYVSKNFDVYQLRTTLLQIRRAEKNFFLRGKKNYLTNNAELVDLFKHLLQTSSLTQDYRQFLGKSIDRYQQAFKRYAQNYFKDKKTQGGLGEFREAAQQLEDQLKSHYVPNIMSDYLTLRRHEKDYFLRRDLKFLQKADGVLEKIKSNIAASSLSPSYKEQLHKQFEVYLKAFGELIDQENKIIDYTNVMREEVNKIEPMIEKNLEKTFRSMENKIFLANETADRKSSIVASMALVITIFSIIFATVLVMGIDKPVRETVRHRTDQNAISRNEEASSGSQSKPQGTDGQATSNKELSSSSVEMAEQAVALLEKLVPYIKKTSNLVQEISRASIEQKIEDSQISRAIQEFEQIIQQNAGASGEPDAQAFQSPSSLVESSKDSGNQGLESADASALPKPARKYHWDKPRNARRKHKKDSGGVHEKHKGSSGNGNLGSVKE